MFLEKYINIKSLSLLAIPASCIYLEYKYKIIRMMLITSTINHYIRQYKKYIDNNSIKQIYSDYNLTEILNYYGNDFVEISRIIENMNLYNQYLDNLPKYIKIIYDKMLSPKYYVDVNVILFKYFSDNNLTGLEMMNKYFANCIDNYINEYFINNLIVSNNIAMMKYIIQHYKCKIKFNHFTASLINSENMLKLLIENNMFIDDGNKFIWLMINRNYCNDDLMNKILLNYNIDYFNLNILDKIESNEMFIMLYDKQILKSYNDNEVLESIINNANFNIDKLKHIIKELIKDKNIDIERIFKYILHYNFKQINDNYSVEYNEKLRDNHAKLLDLILESDENLKALYNNDLLFNYFVEVGKGVAIRYNQIDNIFKKYNISLNIKNKNNQTINDIVNKMYSKCSYAF